MPIQQNADTGKWHIGGGPRGYNSKESATNAYNHYLKNGGAPVKPKEQK